MHRSTHRVAKNTIAQFAARGLEGATNFVVTILLARILGVGPLGTFAFLIIYASLFIFLGTFGLNLLMARDVARRRDQARRYLANALGMALPLAAVIFALQVGIIRLVSSEPLAQVGVYLAAAFAVFHSWELLFVGTFYALERMELETIGIFVEKALLFSAVFALLFTGGGALAVLAAFAAAKAFVVLFYVVLSWRLIGPPLPAADIAMWRRLAAQAWPFSLNILWTAVSFRIHIVLLGLLASQQAAGYFRAGSVLALSLPIFASGLNNALLPLMARAHPDRPESFRFGLERSFTVLSLLGLPMAAGLIALGGPLVRLFYGADFAAAVLVFQLMGATVPLKFATNTIGVALTAADRQPQRTLAVGIGAGISVVLSVALIPALAHTGAAIAAVAGDLAILALVYGYLRRAGYPFSLLGHSARPAVAAAVMGVAVWWMRGIGVLLVIPAGMGIYAAAALAVGAMRRSDIEWLRAALRGAPDDPEAE
ncbi:MAG: flippase [Armatimonadota bacterium]|nr:MAG: flippase [Armatimonadota bacterium]